MHGSGGRPDVAVIGGGIIGTSAACFLAEAGASVVLVERNELAAGASGRNSGSLQQPFDPILAGLHAESLKLYRDLAAREADFELPPEAAGVLMVSFDGEAVTTASEAYRRAAPELQPALIGPAELRRLEPALADGVWGCLLRTGYPVAPASATLAFARRAVRAGAVIRTGQEAVDVVVGEREVRTRLRSGELLASGRALVAAGPWSPTLIPGWHTQPPLSPVWGVVVGVRLPQAPRSILEEIGITVRGSEVASLFSLVSARGMSSVGSTFLPDEPDAGRLAPALLERAAGFVPAISDARREGLRACARPVSFDGRPFIGPLAASERLYVCTGHGPWGISTGPASA
ncbi:MAG: FAD-binding oxidoreductase, partial [Chloroflexota bacterium]|nr:FAD-binding oxidoreductase [Chloroflexota bacterium]